MLKKFFPPAFVFVAIFFVIGASDSQADPADPQSCGQSFPSGISIDYQTKNFFHFTTNRSFDIHFYKSGEFTYSSDELGIEHETIDGTQLKDTSKAAFFSNHSSANVDCTEEDQLHECGSSIKTVVAYLNYEKEILDKQASSPQKDQMYAAIDCATSIALSFMWKSMQISDGQFQVQPGVAFTLDKLSADQITAVKIRMIALEAAKNADEAATAAALAQATSATAQTAASANSSNASKTK